MLQWSVRMLQPWRTQRRTSRHFIVSYRVHSKTSPVPTSSCRYQTSMQGPRENDKCPSVLGTYGIGKCNSNDELLLALYTEFDLIVTNTMFKQKDAHKTTWTHPRSRHGHMIDFIITRCWDKINICSTRTMRGANWTDHQMLRSRVIFSIRKKHNQKGAMKPVKLNTNKLRNTSYAESLVQEMCTTPLKHLSANMRRNIKTGSIQMTRFHGI